MDEIKAEWYIYIYIYVCVCVCIYLAEKREEARSWRNGLRPAIAARVGSQLGKKGRMSD